MGKIIILRHAKVNINNPKIYAKDMQRFIDKYNSLEIEQTNISDELKELLNEANFFMTSELKRAKDTLSLFNKESNLASSLFNEADLPYSNTKGFKLPAKVWAVIFRVAWLFGYSKNATSYKATKLRAKEAANMLLTYLKTNKTIAIVGHGVMNRVIIKELKNKGALVSQNRGSSNLSYIVVEY